MNLEYVLPIFQIPFVYCHHTNVVTSPSLVEMKKSLLGIHSTLSIMLSERELSHRTVVYLAINH